MIYLIKSFIRLLYNNFKRPNTKIAFSAVVSMDSELSEGVQVLEASRLGSCKVSRYTYVGMNCRIERTEIGPFTSIGPEVICGMGSHPLNYVSTYPGFYTNKASGATWFGINHNYEDKLSVEIGADVWIGSRAIIMSGIKIGVGAIIGAGAVVTKDIPPYAVVGGVPAKILKYRFEDSIITSLVTSSWWELDKNILKETAKYMNTPEKFLSYLKEKHNEF
jgi:acetyltransferase-like isoleucine patch superfamily enzyme